MPLSGAEAISLPAMWQRARSGFFERFLELHDWVRKHFIDDQYGEWYAYLHRDGSPRIPDKGNWIKSAFHIPRNLMKIMLLLERHIG